ncbi:SgcJ/EcaC family oxidoreductase [Sphingomonas sp.]|uniref:SgcJ/EcaC family oxidoreductase n=1 Tax=Sphingomonas sp. TaxID=28214 RepID=UPI00286E07C1|nr:SgcJ/EcaC family oxidoreductase [Sphingomonas sp.]
MPTPTAGDEAAIRQSVLAMTTAFNTRDDAALIALSAPDADFVTVVGRWTRSPHAYVESRRTRFSGPLKNASLRPLETHIRFVRPDIAVVHVTHEISGMLDEAGQLLPPHPEFSTRLYVKQRGRWLLSAFHNSARVAPVR